MIDKIYNSFFEATKDVFKLMLDLTDISQSEEICSNCDEIKISIEIVGELTGKVIYRFPKTTSLKIVNIMSGMEVASIDDFVISAMSEISNIISGNALTLLEGNEVKCDILPPKLYDKEDDEVYSINSTHCLTTSAGEVNIEILLNASK